MKQDCVFRRVYRMDKKAEETWSGELVRAPGQGPVPVDPVDSVARQSEELRTKYLECVLQTKQWYSVSVPRVGMGPDGEVVQESEVHHFQVVSRTTAKSRPKLMPTIETHRHTTTCPAWRFVYSASQGLPTSMKMRQPSLSIARQRGWIGATSAHSTKWFAV